MAMVLAERDFCRPCPVPETVYATGICSHGRALSWAGAVGWFPLITATQWAFFSCTSRHTWSLTPWRASKMTTVPARSSG